MKEGRQFRQLLEEAAAFHGHLCSGQIIGVRLAMFGLHELGIADPLGDDRKKLVVFVEAARCFADAIMTVTGCRIGKRSFKLIDNGKIAATFLNMTTGRAVRVALGTDLTEEIARRYPGFSEKEAEKKAYMEMLDDELFSTQEVKVALKEEDTPGTPISRTRCLGCGETIVDKREVRLLDKIFCRGCAAGESYYSPYSPVEENLAKGSVQ